MIWLPFMNRETGHSLLQTLPMHWVFAALLVPMLPASGVDFAKDIEPILVKRCSECHGPDKQKGDLRLDSRSAAIKAAKSGKTAIAPGKPEDSELLARVLTKDPDEVMPKAIDSRMRRLRPCAPGLKPEPNGLWWTRPNIGRSSSRCARHCQ
jgi:hypothetical protein